jgi:hypothetical protein
MTTKKRAKDLDACDHSYLPIGNTYYKNNESGEGRDNNVVYQMVYCQRCAKTIGNRRL